MQRTTPSGARRICATIPCSIVKRDEARSSSFSASIVSRMYSTVRSNSLLGVGEALADLPHQEADDLLAVLPHPARELLHAADPPLDRHRGPGAAPEVPRLHGRLEDLERLVGAERRGPADDLGRGGRASFVRLADG